MKHRPVVLLAVAVLVLAALACGPIGSLLDEAGSIATQAAVELTSVVPTAAAVEPTTLPPTFTPPAAPTEAPTEAPVAVELYSQWAASAVASSEYGEESWAASQAAGPPDVHPDCSDSTEAWASAGSDTREWLELTYATPVLPVELRVFETLTPDQVVKVDLVDANNIYYEVYTAEPRETECPFILSVPLTSIEVPIVRVRIYVDQAVLRYWNEIDAVELIGYPADGSVPPAGGDGGDGTGGESFTDFQTPANFLWRIGGPGGGEFDFGTLTGSDGGPDGLLYVADSWNGVLVVDGSGSVVRIIGKDEISIARDVVYNDSNDLLYVADWGTSSVQVFTPEGEPIISWGGNGTGPGEFGTFAPDTLAIGPNGQVFVLDENKDANDETFYRVQVFDTAGNFVREFLVEDADDVSPDSMAFGPDGLLYMVGFFANDVAVYDLDGNHVRDVIMPDLDFATMETIDFDDAGNMYISLWAPNGMMKLTADGTLIARYGVDYDDDDFEGDYPPGALAQTSGGGVLRDGSAVFVFDGNSDHTYLNAFTP